MHRIERSPLPALELTGLDLNLLVVLAVLLHEGSVTRAAERLGRTQSAVSHALDRLREALGDPLFVRAGRDLTPTPRAEGLRAPVAAATADLRALFRETPRFDPATSPRHFTLTASDYLQVVLIPPLVSRLRQSAPASTLTVRGPKAQVCERLARGEYDFSLSVALEDSGSLFSQKLFDDRFVCLLAEGHPALRHGLDRSTFLRLPHALVSPLGGGSGYVDRELAREGQSRHVAVVLPDFMVAPRVLAGTDLVLTLPERVASLFVGTGVVAVEPPLPLPPLAGHLVWHERLANDPGALWLRGLLGEVAAALGGPKVRPRALSGRKRTAP